MDLLSKNLLKEFGLGGLSEEKQTEILLSIGRIIHQNVILRVLGELSEADKDEFDKLLAEKKSDDGATLEFLNKKIKNLDKIVEEEIIKFKETSADFLKKLSA